MDSIDSDDENWYEDYIKHYNNAQSVQNWPLDPPRLANGQVIDAKNTNSDLDGAGSDRDDTRDTATRERSNDQHHHHDAGTTIPTTFTATTLSDSAQTTATGNSPWESPLASNTASTSTTTAPLFHYDAYRTTATPPPLTALQRTQTVEAVPVLSPRTTTPTTNATMWYSGMSHTGRWDPSPVVLAYPMPEPMAPAAMAPPPPPDVPFLSLRPTRHRTAPTSSPCRVLVLVAATCLLAALLVGMGFCASGACRRHSAPSVAALSPLPPPPTLTPSMGPLTSPNEFLGQQQPSTSQSPTARTTALIDFINNITLSGRTIVASDNATTAEDLALQWLVANHATSWSPNTTAVQWHQLQQRYSLATLWFANARHGGRSALDAWYNTSYWLTDMNECQWYGVTCRGSLAVAENATNRPTISSDSSNDVVHLQLDTNNLHGTIPADLGLLLNLVRLDVHNNSLSGSIPATLGRWTNLEFLRLSNNTLTGTIPVAAVQSWTHINFCSFHSNDLVGSVPSVICNFANLSYLIADCNLVCPCCGLCYND
jgi:hypothetical protein